VTFLRNHGFLWTVERREILKKKKERKKRRKYRDNYFIYGRDKNSVYHKFKIQFLRSLNTIKHERILLRISFYFLFFFSFRLIYSFESVESKQSPSHSHFIFFFYIDEINYLRVMFYKLFCFIIHP